VHLTNEDIREILVLLEETGLDELHLQAPQYHLTLRREADGWVEASEVRSPPTLVAEGAAPSAPPGLPVRAADVPAVDGLHDVRAPLPGTFYRAPKPGDPPFVEIGGRVEEHSVVGLIETMKLFNSVTAGVGGVVREILVENGELAHHHALLMRIEPDAS
jgi:acetyl-CoA carboxylase biotin carboxyl carrier protein